jgi:hypothetical protein
VEDGLGGGGAAVLDHVGLVQDHAEPAAASDTTVTITTTYDESNQIHQDV